MCGILAVWSNYRNISNDRFEGAVQSLRTRGPDGFGSWYDSNEAFALGHARLSIFDPSPMGAQPMQSAGANCVVSFNGAIYNFRSLKRELANEYSFETESDTEVILAVYEVFGVQGFRKLEGMFAFALFDTKHQLLHLCRDEVGKKPLYIYRQQGELIAASDTTAIRKYLGRELSLCRQSAAEFLRFGCTLSSSIYDNVSELAPASVLTITAAGRETISSLSRPHYQSYQHDDDIPYIVERMLGESVGTRLQSDVPVGVFLSGGIDSGLVTKFATQYSRQRVKTFTLTSKGSSYDEGQAARQVSEYLGTDHYEVEAESFSIQDVTKLFASASHPIGDPSYFPAMLVSELANKHITVAINGDGGDELFGGYRRHQVAFMLDALARLGIDRGFLSCCSMLPSLPGLTGPIGKLFHILNALGRTDEFILSLSDNGVPRHHFDRETIYLDGFYDVAYAKEAFDTSTYLRTVLFFEQRYLLLQGLFKKIDQATMANKIEARSPLVDSTILHYVNSIPIEKRYKGKRTKWILREIADRNLPPTIANAPKKGFEFPIEDLFKTLSPTTFSQRLHDSTVIRDVLTAHSIEKYVKDFKLKTFSSYEFRRLWFLFVLASWEANDA